MRSIRRFLVLFLISTLTLIIFSAALQGYKASMAIANEKADQGLSALLVNLMALNNQASAQNVKDISLAMQIWRDQELLFTSGHMTHKPMSDFEPGYSTRNFTGQRWRVLTAEGEDNTWFMVAQPISAQIALTESIILATINPFIVSIPVIAILLYWAVTHGLSPLKQLSRKLKQRHAQDLSPVSPEANASELDPVISTLNQLLHRLQSAFEREQQFSANAAHELRTPLSLLKLNLHQLNQELGGNMTTVKSLQRDTDRMIHVVNQILALSRTNPENFSALLAPVNLEQVAQQVIADIYPSLEKKAQQIELIAKNITLTSTEFCLYSLLQNLVGNAHKYAPEQAQIQVTIEGSPRGVRLCVEDSGAGLNDTQMTQIFQRFYRADQPLHQEGSGLGLAIVKQVVELHQAEISAKRSALGGLAVVIEFTETVA